MYAGCYLSLPRHCTSPPVWHIWQTPSPINAMVTPSLLPLYVQHAEFHECSVHGIQLSLWRRSSLFLMNITVYCTCWANSQKITRLLGLKRHHDGCEMLERHRRTKCWPTPSITHAEQMTQFSLSLSPSRRVYQCCPEYLTGKRAHPWDLICTGVHLVEVVWDNLHIMSHLHLSFMKMAHLRGARRQRWAARKGEGLFADTVAKTSVCCANPRGS